MTKNLCRNLHPYRLSASLGMRIPVTVSVPVALTARIAPCDDGSRRCETEHKLSLCLCGSNRRGTVSTLGAKMDSIIRRSGHRFSSHCLILARSFADIGYALDIVYPAAAESFARFFLLILFVRCETGISGAAEATRYRAPSRAENEDGEERRTGVPDAGSPLGTGS